MLSVLTIKKKTAGHKRFLDVLDMLITFICGLHISKVIKMYTLNMCHFVYLKYLNKTDKKLHD